MGSSASIAVSLTSISRQRDAIAPGEPTRGSFIVWQVLGFGGRSYPLLYARVASWLARATQAMLHKDSWSRRASWGPAAVQVYVDDPAIVVSGSSAQQSTSIDLAILWWLVLGIPLSWRKGAVHAATEQHVWIGVEFRLLRSGVARMTLPPAFVQALLDLCHLILQNKKVPRETAEALVGKAGRVAHVLPLARPFVAGLYAALSASKAAARCRAREAPPGQVACRHFKGPHMAS